MSSHVTRYSRLFGVDLEGISFGPPTRDTTGDFVPPPGTDLTSIRATLAAGPGPQWHASTAKPPRPRKRKARNRKWRPHRGEHVKRTRISYDAFDGQTPKIPYSAICFSDTRAKRQSLASDAEAAEESETQNIAPGRTTCGRLWDIMAMILRKILFGRESDA